MVVYYDCNKCGNIIKYLFINFYSGDANLNIQLILWKNNLGIKVNGISVFNTHFRKQRCNLQRILFLVLLCRMFKE